MTATLAMPLDGAEREAASDQPPPETVRRLIYAILDHHLGLLTDDASPLLALWRPRAHGYLDLLLDDSPSW